MTTTDLGVSEREAEVLALVGEHLTNAEIAAKLFISVRTVESHVSSLLRKLDAADRRALAALAQSSPGAPGGGPESTAAATAAADPGGATATTSALPASSLPAPLTSFVGRQAERTVLADALVTHRLVSAIGPGGVGKTRLALAVAADVTDRYAQGGWYVDLVPVTDPTMIGAAVADVLGFAELYQRSPTETVVTRLADAEALVVLDNCEHLVEGAAGFVERLLTACPRVTVLVTSQARLGLPFERVIPVAGLSLVADGDDRGSGDAVALFLDRAAMVGWAPATDDDLRRVAAVCDALDGSALAIELAAARLGTRGLDSLEAALADRLGLLTGGARLDERHRSLRSALDWSYELLSPTDQAVLRQASVFAAPFTAEAAGAVAVEPAPVDRLEVAEALAHLADMSLLMVTAPAGVTRYRMLESIRQYGAELLDAQGEDTAVRDRHLRWCQTTASDLIAQAAAALSPSATAGADARAEFVAVADDLRAALRWAQSTAGRQSGAHTLAVSLGRLAYDRGLYTESQRRHEQAAEMADDHAEAARLLTVAAEVAMSRLSGDDAMRLFQAAADAARKAGDNRTAALELARAAELLERSPGLLHEEPDPNLSMVFLAQARELAGDDPHVEAAVLTVEAGSGSCTPRPFAALDSAKVLALAQQHGDTRLESAALDQLAVQQLVRGQVDAGMATSIRRTELLAPLIGQRPELAFEYSDALHMASLTSIGAGDLHAGLVFARRRYELPFHRDDAHLGINWLLVAEALLGELDQASELGEEFLVGWQQAGRPPLGGFATAAEGGALVAGLRGDIAGAERWSAVATDMRRNKSAHDHLAYKQVFDGIVALHRGEVAEAVGILSHPPEALNQWHTAAWRQWYAALWAESAVLADPADLAAANLRFADAAAAAAAAAAEGRIVVDDPSSSSDTGATAAGEVDSEARPDADVPERLARAKAIAAGNPLTTLMVERAEGLASGEIDRLPAIAEALAPLSRYQQARTLVLAGEPAATDGHNLMASLGAAPMRPPRPGTGTGTPAAQPGRRSGK